MGTLYTGWDITPCRTEGVDFFFGWGGLKLMNSATEIIRVAGWSDPLNPNPYTLKP